MSIRLSTDVATALRERRPVVALESSVFAQGLPIPQNREAAQRMLAALRSRGVTAAVTAVLGGVPTAGVEEAELERLLAREGVAKVSARDIPAVVAGRGDGATTVAATLLLARLAGIEVFATGGIGGVHREPAYDESADLAELARSPVVTVCAGAKSILDLPATLERLETHGVTVLGYRTNELPGFFTAVSGLRLEHRVESAVEIAAVYRASRALGRESAVLVVQPPPESAALPRDLVDAAVSRALDRASRDGVRGSAVTPYLLAAVERETGGRSLGANLALLERNAALAAEVAIALADAVDGTRAERAR